MSLPRPHDLLWIDQPGQLEWSHEAPAWVAEAWSPRLPVVVRRDRGLPGRIPVGIRGRLRAERAAAWVPAGEIRRVVSPEALIERITEPLDDRCEALPVIRAMRRIASVNWPWTWGVTGSCGYMLATGVTVCRPDSDLDLLIRCPRPMAAEDFAPLVDLVSQLPCRVDIQLETPLGGCALAEWLRDGKVMVKTDSGPRRVSSPWHTQSGC